MLEAVTHWHRSAWDSLWTARRQGRLHHALLLTGPRGVGKSVFARALSQSLLCREPDEQGQACGHCSTCSLFLAGTHPDFRWLQPLEEGKTIRIDQVRELVRYVYISRQYEVGSKVVVVEPADRMTVESANALLKTLEEPAPFTHLILISDAPARLPATIRSRCQAVPLQMPERSVALAWLKAQLPDCPEDQWVRALDLVGGAPLVAMQRVQQGGLDYSTRLLDDLQTLALGKGNPVQIAAQWRKDLGCARVLDWLGRWLADLIRYLGAGGGSCAPRFTGEAVKNLPMLSERLDLKGLYGYWDYVRDAIRLADSAVNDELMLEGVLVGWCRLFHERKN